MHARLDFQTNITVTGHSHSSDSNAGQVAPLRPNAQPLAPTLPISCAAVACRQLGFNSAELKTWGSDGGDTITDVICNGNETSLGEGTCLPTRLLCGWLVQGRTSKLLYLFMSAAAPLHAAECPWLVAMIKPTIPILDGLASEAVAWTMGASCFNGSGSRHAPIVVRWFLCNTNNTATVCSDR